MKLKLRILREAIKALYSGKRYYVCRCSNCGTQTAYTYIAMQSHLIK